MNIELFRQHTASRRIVPVALDDSPVIDTGPESFRVGGNMLNACTVLAVDLSGDRQYIFIELDKESAEWIFSEERKLVEAKLRTRLRVSRFRRGFDGMTKPRLRYTGRVEPGGEVRVCVTLRASKGRAYFDLGRDIEVTREPERAAVPYLSDGE